MILIYNQDCNPEMYCDNVIPEILMINSSVCDRHGPDLRSVSEVDDDRIMLSM